MNAQSALSLYITWPSRLGIGLTPQPGSRNCVEGFLLGLPFASLYTRLFNLLFHLIWMTLEHWIYRTVRRTVAWKHSYITSSHFWDFWTPLSSVSMFLVLRISKRWHLKMWFHFQNIEKVFTNNFSHNCSAKFKYYSYFF